MSKEPSHPRINHFLLYAIIGSCSFITRFYLISKNPAWFDEIYSFQVSIQSINGILINSLYESHPPLYYLLLKFSTGFGVLRTEFGLRWLSAVSAGLSLTIFFFILHRLLNDWLAIWTWLMFLFSPAIMYFSQEARAYIIVMLVATSSLVCLYKLEKSNQDWKWWFLFVAFSLIGIFSAYSYGLILSVQLLCLFLKYHSNQKYWISFGLVVLGCLPLAPLLISNLQNDLSRTANAVPLTFPVVAQALLAGDPPRYGVFWGSMWLPIIFGICAAGSLGYAVKVKSWLVFYAIAQVLIPFAVFFLLAEPIFNVKMPAYQSRQFLVLLPAFGLCVAYGMDWFLDLFQGWWKNLPLILTGGIILAASYIGLQRYWTITKSPEGAAMKVVRDHMQSGEALISLHYSLTAAASFYLNKTDNVYSWPQKEGDEYWFSQTADVLRGMAIANSRFSVKQLRSLQQYWVLSDTRSDQTVRDMLARGCRINFQERSGPFEVMEVNSCTP